MPGSRDRIIDVLAGRLPDRVPYFELLIHGGVISRMHPGADYLDFCEREDIDIVFAKWKFSNTWLDRDRGIYTNEWKFIRKAGAEQTDDYLDGPIHAMQDLRSFRPPDPLAEAGFHDLMRALGRFKKDRMVAFFSKGTFNHVWYLMGGMEPYLVAMYTEPGLVLALNEMTSEFHMAQAQKAMDLGADIIALADDYAFRQQSFIPREKFVTFCLPALQKMCDLVHRNGCRLLFHSDGNLSEYLDLVVEAGIDFLHPVEPGAMDIRKVHAQYGERVVVCGNVDCANTLTFGEPADAEREVAGLLRDLAPRGRYILTSSNTIHSQVRPDTYRAMLDTLRRTEPHPLQATRSTRPRCGR